MVKNKKILTIRECVEIIYEQLSLSDVYFGHGTDNAWDEAVNLIVGSLNLDFNDPKLDQNYLNSNQYKKISKLLNKRITKHIPIAYLLKKAYFCGLEFYVDKRVIIPRSSIAELIQNKFKPWFIGKKINQILDLCTGSGCIAIAAAKTFPEAHVDAFDISKDALEVAKINVKKHKASKQITLLQGDLFAPIGDKKYDIIVSNPPYVSRKEMRNLSAEYYHEPSIAFAGLGKDGLKIVEKIIKEASQHLTKNGILIVEVGNNWEALQNKHPEIPFIWLEFEHSEGGVFVLGSYLEGSP